MSESLNMHDDEAAANTTGDGLGLLTVGQVRAYVATQQRLAAVLGDLAWRFQSGYWADAQTESAMRREQGRTRAALMNVNRKLAAHDRAVRAAS